MDNTPQNPATPTVAPHVRADLLREMLDSATRAVIESQELTDVTGTSEIYAIVREHLEPKLTEAIGDPLAAAVAKAHEAVVQMQDEDRELMSQPRYANAPAVTGSLILQRWDEGDNAQDVATLEVTFPTPWLARQNPAELEEWLQYSTLEDWVADDLGVLGEHHGPYYLSVDTDELRAWLMATAE